MTQQIYTASLEQRLAWLYHKIAILSQKTLMQPRDEYGIMQKYSHTFLELHEIAKGLNIK